MANKDTGLASASLRQGSLSLAEIEVQHLPRDIEVRQENEMYVQDFPEEVHFTIGAEVTVLTAIMGRVRLISEALTPIPGEISPPVVKEETDLQLICQNMCWIMDEKRSMSQVWWQGPLMENLLV